MVLKIHLELRQLGYDLSLFSALGSKIMDRYVSEDTTEIDTSPYPAGIFYYKVIWDDKKEMQRKLVKK